MAENMSLREFMEEVERRINSSSKEALCTIIMEWARNTDSSSRDDFLLMLAPPAKKEPSAYGEELLEDICSLLKRVEKGDYSEGWGWDDEIHDEREFGDESWADEADDFFKDARDAMFAGNYSLAKEAYALLFEILKMGEETGHLPGPPDPLEILETDLEEAVACYLRSLYMASPVGNLPVMIWKTMQKVRHHIKGNLNLNCLINADTRPLPEFSEFLQAWITLIRSTNDDSSAYLLCEATVLSGGTPAIAELACREGRRFPRAYIEWIGILEKQKDYTSMLSAAKQGLLDVPKDYVIRREIAGGMIRAAGHLKDRELRLAGWHEAFYSMPSLSDLLSMLSLAEETGCYDEKISAAIERIETLRKNEKSDGHEFIENADKIKSTASEILLCQAYLLAGRYRDALCLCENKKALGWTYGSNPKALVIPFFLVLLKGNNKRTTPNLEELWNTATGISGEYHTLRDADVPQRFKDAMAKVFCSIRLSDDEADKYMHLCITEAGNRADAIVGEKHRGSYYKAANLLVAAAEVLASRGRESDGTRLIDKYHQVYNRHSAFRKELKEAAKRSGMFI
ncbi:MAG: hypothetical protein ABIG84_06290 [archaeon]